MNFRCLGILDLKIKNKKNSGKHLFRIHISNDYNGGEAKTFYKINLVKNSPWI